MTGGAMGRRVAAQLDAVRAAGRWRTVRSFDARGPDGTLHPAGADGTGGRAVTSFASNDYLGLSAHPAVVAAAHAALDRWGTGSTASRLVVGSRPPHHELEEALAAWKGTEAALVFPTGYMANVGVLTALAGPGTRIVSDELNHASIVDGCRLARGELVVAPHADPDALAEILGRDDRPTVVVTDTVFSMDGDAVDLDGLAALCTRHGAALVLDEAHAVLGPDLDPADHPDLLLVRVGTLSKTLGSLGGFVACSAPVRDLLVNAARSFIFTTALSPADAAAGLAAVEVVRSPEGAELRARLRGHVDRLRPGHPSPIVPVVLGPEEAALAAATALLEAGLLVPAIRPPTVPEGTSRLRVALSAAHTGAQVDALRAALASLPPPSSPEPVTRTGALTPETVTSSPALSEPVTRTGALTPETVTSSPGASRAEQGGPSGTGRAERVIAVLGTGTEVGKTWVAARLLEELRASGTTVAARKPAQSAQPDDPHPSDAEVLAAATGEDPRDVCPPHRRYAVAMAPPMAAEALGLAPFTVADLAAEVTWPAPVEVGVVETAGGVLSPAAGDGTSLDLAAAVHPDELLLVADAGLGTINGVRLSLAAVAAHPGTGGRPVVVLLNRFVPTDRLHVANRAALEADGTAVVTDPAALAARWGAPR